MVESVSPQDPEAVAFLNLIANNTPDYIQVQEINLENWFTAGVCTLTCTCLDYSDVNDYKASFETEEMQKTGKYEETILLAIASISLNCITVLP